MALKHWSGSIPQKAVVWKCPTCGVENTGPLEQGCASCHAGDPKQVGKGAALPPEAPSPLSVAAGVPFDAWWGIYEPGMDGQIGPADIARDAWEAGAAWALREHAAGRMRPASLAMMGQPVTTDPLTAPPGGGWRMQLITPDGLIGEPLDGPAHATIVAALAFYLDNQLGYGAIPGQLTAAECRELIEHLKEPEPIE